MTRKTTILFALPVVIGLAAAAALLLLLPSHAKDVAASDVARPQLAADGSAWVVPAGSPLRDALVVSTVGERPVSAQLALPASVEADPARLVKVLPPVAGRIVRMNKSLGDAVKTGDILFTIESADFAQAVSDARKAEAAAALARTSLDRQLGLATADIAADHDVEQARSDFEQVRSELERARARLAQLGVGATAAASSAVAVRSPITGRVVDLDAAEGAVWNDATASVMTVADLSTVFVTASAQEKDLAQLYVGQTATVLLDAYGEPLTGTVQSIGDLVDADTRTVKARLRFDNRDGRLKPGMFARALFSARPHGGIVVPMTAVVQSGFYSRAFVETAQGRFEPRVLALGAQVGDQVEVVSGLKRGDRVVVKNGVLLQ